jgi:hypothetical protein
VIDETLIDEVMQNFPEASMCLTCVSFDYENMVYEFWDQEVTPETKEASIVPAVIQDMELRRSGFVKDAVTYRLSRNEIQNGMNILLGLIFDGKLKGLGLDKDNINDAGCWDAWSADALMQCAIFGDVIYG